MDATPQPPIEKLKRLDRISLPRNTLVVLCGPAGCGKSTFAARNFAPTQIVSSDECRARITDDPSNQDVSGHAFDLMHYVIEKRLYLSRTTVADATHLDRASRRPLVKAARWFDFKAAALVFNLPLETCLARNAARKRVVPEDAILRQYEMLQETLQTIRHERFNYIFVLNEEEQERVEIEIGPPRWRASLRNTRTQS